jgi:hypothetical protein
MNILKLKPVKCTRKIMDDLEKKKLIKLLRPTKKVLRAPARKGVVDAFYKAGRKSGPHMLMCIGKSESKPEMSYHSECEEVLLIKQPEHKTKPLFLLIALEKYAKIKRKIDNNTLRSRDFMLIKLRYNDPEISFFTILKNTFHCELTSKTMGTSPYFFVTEPSLTVTEKIKMKKYKFAMTI